MLCGNLFRKVDVDYGLYFRIGYVGQVWIYLFICTPTPHLRLGEWYANFRNHQRGRKFRQISIWA